MLINKVSGLCLTLNHNIIGTNMLSDLFQRVELALLYRLLSRYTTSTSFFLTDVIVALA